jgi:hypothetical protein
MSVPAWRSVRLAPPQHQLHTVMPGGPRPSRQHAVQPFSTVRFIDVVAFNPAGELKL